jgi:hypothetical protein
MLDGMPKYILIWLLLRTPYKVHISPLPLPLSWIRDRGRGRGEICTLYGVRSSSHINIYFGIPSREEYL